MLDQISFHHSWVPLWQIPKVVVKHFYQFRSWCIKLTGEFKQFSSFTVPHEMNCVSKSWLFFQFPIFRVNQSQGSGKSWLSYLYIFLLLGADLVMELIFLILEFWVYFLCSGWATLLDTGSCPSVVDNLNWFQSKYNLLANLLAQKHSVKIFTLFCFYHANWRCFPNTKPSSSSLN